jgi:hypothetical protein
MEDFEVPIDHLKEDFSAFLSRESNRRLIFSGVFGTGKTYFLKKFFADSDNYVALHLYPTNYAISSNRDVIQLIKYDMLYELIQYPEIRFEKIEPTFFEALFFLKDDLPSLMRRFASKVATIGKFVSGIDTRLRVMFAGLEKAFNEVSKKQEALRRDEAEAIKRLIREIEAEEGTIYENDFYTQLVNGLISRLRIDGSKGVERKVVLIIDDLDRIDPEHIFRILNVFAVHFDIKRDNANKFDVDKVILCCDFNNIRRIFSNKYGHNVDFNGYIGKFFDSEIYPFDNTKMVRAVVEVVLPSLRVNSTYSRPGFMDVRSVYYAFAHLILTSMVESGTLTLYTLRKLRPRHFNLRRYKLLLGNVTLSEANNHLVAFFIFIWELFNASDNVFSAIENTIFDPIEDPYRMNKVVSDLVLLADWQGHKFVIKDTEYVCEFDNIKLSYLLQGDRATVNAIESLDLPAYSDMGRSVPCKDLFLQAFRVFVENARRA